MDKQNNILNTQVIIVGAGPTGLSLAAQLLRYNIKSIIIEKNEKATAFSKALVVQARTLEIFQELGIAEKAINEGQVTTAMNFFYKGKQKASVNIAGLGKGLSPFPYALSLEQSKTEKLLVDYLSANQKEIQWKSEFIHFEQNENGVTGYYKDSIGQVQKIEADYLVGCDGASSQVRHQMGLLFEGDTVPKIFYVADVKLKSAVINKNELFMFMIQKGFILFFPMEGKGHYRIVGILPNGSIAGEEIKIDDIKNYIKQQIISPVEVEEVLWFSSYKVHSRKADSFEKGRCYIAGDAAHIHTPAGGQGMNTGIQDAYNLAWKIAYTIGGKINPVILSTYNIERSENAKHLLQTTDRMFDLMAGANPYWNFLRLNFFPLIIGIVTKSTFIKKIIFPLISQTGITYEGNYLITKSSIGKVKAGVRMPYFIFSDGKQIFEYLAEPAFKILFFGNHNKNNSWQLSDAKIKIVSYIFKEIPASLFGSEANFYILLRPDNHISYIGKDLDICKGFLDKIASR
ncbi:MAG TPA: FAD-dependent monooxygenase [Puia sp.]|jgi:2-polyprenyl-6-methoxyphenol hydroxylase-like FAD-dependent oxidoreductase|nr:FAD-dependent monooxygenase [Puia sp.]